MIRPEGRLTWYPPHADGLVTQFGFRHIWRLDKTWKRRDAEWIEPLQAIAPVGRTTPQDTELANWEAGAGWNNKWRDLHVSGNPVSKWIEFYDGSVYAAGTDMQTYQGVVQSKVEWHPRFAFHLLRYAPPEGQGVYAGTFITLRAKRRLSGTWIAGDCSLYLPLQNAYYHQALLHAVAPQPSGAYNIFDWTLPDNDILSDGPASTTLTQGVSRESWLFEYEEVWQDEAGALWAEEAVGRTFLRSILLIRNSRDLGEWWVYNSEDLRLIEGKLRVGCAGCVQAFNIAPIRYGERAGYTWPAAATALPVAEGSTWAATPVWDTIATVPEGWAVTEAGHTDGTLRPLVTMTATGAPLYNRPLLWYATQTHAAVVGDASATSDTSDNYQHLRRLEVHLNRDYKGATARADFYPWEGAAPTGLVENAKVAVEIGWDDAAGEGLTLTRVATQYILPGSLALSRDGDVAGGAVQLRLDLGDYAAARLSRKQIVDYGQAGGWYVEDWAQHVAGRLGFNIATQLTVDASVAGLVLPFAELPSLPSLDAQDGDDWLGHIKAVEQARKIRVGFDKAGTGGMFVDGGPPRYQAGTSAIAFVLDYDTLTQEDVLYTIEHQPSAENYRNCLKCIVGRDRKRVEYRCQALANREVGIGDDWWQVLVDDDAEDFAGLVDLWDWRTLGWQEVLVWEGPLRPDLRPDEFLQVSDLPDMRLTTSIFQIVEHTMVADGDTGEAISRIVAVPAKLVDDDQAVATGGAVDATTADVDLDLMATGGLLE